MASIIKIKRKSNAAGAPGSLQEGELAVNLFSKKLYVGNSSGVSQVGGEDFRLTTQAPTAGTGAYLKVKGDTEDTSNTVLLSPGEGLDIVRNANGSIIFSGEDASTSNKGIASFSSDNFAVASGVVTIKDGGIVEAELANDAVTNAKLADDAVDSDQIADGAIDTVHIGDDQVTNAKIGAKAVDTTELQDAAVTSAKIAAKGIQANNIADGIITSAMISAGGITANAIGNDSIALGTKTTGNYVATITGTANEITVSGSGSENAGVTIALPDDVTIGQDLTVTRDLGVSRNLTVDGNLTVEGAVTYISSSTVNVDDSMLKLSANNTADTVDTGVYGKYVVSGNSAVQYAGYFRDAGDGTFKFYTGLDVEPTTTVDTTDTGYGLAQVDAIIDGGTY